MVKSFRFTRAFDVVLGTFHTVFLVLALVVPLYTSGNLGGILASLNTVVGTGVFVLVWATTWYCTQRAVKAIRRDDRIELPTGGRFVWLGMKWGALNGVFFYLPLLLALFASFIASAPGNPDVDPIVDFANRALIYLVYFGFALVIGSPIALLVGGVVGFVFACLDGAMIWLAYALVKRLNVVPA